MKDLQDLFEHQLKDLYSAEDQLTDALSKMVKNAKDSNLKKIFENHLEETKVHKKRIEEICEDLGIDPEGEMCKAIEGLIKEAEDFLNEDTTNDVKNAGMIAEAQRVEHYEISAYGTAVRYAKELGHQSIAAKLQKTLDEEYQADQELNDLAEERLNKKAKE
ncbi:ferritin-like domain-containing protein [Mesonia sp. K7]|uniref:YciE/YciF ferroxidase family protein n=1 Tax=Mesonia sp. K7 TaxID=2218606 RepID=UPI000DA80E00|nr:ferritin-like domain-containing protein [Mesonia sp. K7]PZD76714.1 ferritin-like domain-containing protein [Mesonia sp. K7]